MIDYTNFPSTRFLGSKLRLLPWIYENIKDLEFNSVLDAFGGTASFSYLMKKMGKKVYYNDILKFNQDIAIAIIENDDTKVDLNYVIKLMRPKVNKNYKRTIQKNFRGIYFKNYENKWLDVVIQNIFDVKDKYKKSLMLSALYQSCLIKRPFNLFHRNNLNLRTNDVKRNFGNKKTWDTPFRRHFSKFISGYNNSVFNNGKKNKVLGGYDVLKIPKKKYDLVYLDPPYLSNKSKINYLDCYHFLEGLSKYNSWEQRIDYDSKTRRLYKFDSIDKWTNSEIIVALFEKMISRYKNSNIVLSYRDDGIPSITQMSNIFENALGERPIINSIKYKYALSNGSSKELLFIYKN